jgi:hypothetical protein
MVCQFQNGMVCPPATSEAGARRPRSSSNYGVLFTFLFQTLKTHTLESSTVAKIPATAVFYVGSFHTTCGGKDI